MRRGFGMAAAAIAAVLLAGCASAPYSDPHSDPSLPVQDAPSAPFAPSGSFGSSGSPVGLVGMWRVTGAEGQDDTTWLRLTGRDAILWDRCGVFFGKWSTAQHLALISFSSGTDLTCSAKSALPSPRWIDRVTSFRSLEPQQWDLLDAEGATVAHLAVDGHPPVSKNFLAEYTHTPRVTAADEKYFVAPVPLPDPSFAYSTLVGRWVPVIPSGNANLKPFVEFHSDGTMSGTDGCNSIRDVRWTTGAGGLLLTGDSVITAVGCDGSALMYWALGASRTAMIDHELTFFDAKGKQLGQAIRG